jgi:transposase-like protein
MTVREIQGFLREQYGTEVSPDFISTVTDEVMAEVTAWQVRPLEVMYPVVFFDALRVKIKEEAVQTCIVHLIRNSLDDTGWKDRKGLAVAIRPIYTAASAEAAHAELEALAQGPIPDGGGCLAQCLGPRDSVLRVSARGAQGDLHHQRH